MVPVIWALVSADVNAGTASAARIAIIAITTSNSMSINAEKGLFIFIFIVDFFISAVVLRVFGLRGLVLGLGILGVCCGFCSGCSGGFNLRMGALIAVFTDKVNIYFYFFWGQI